MIKILAGISALITGTIAFFTAWISRKFLVAAASVAAFVALVTAFLFSINTVIGSIVALAIVPSWLSSVIGIFVPSNYAVMISLILSAKISRAAFDLAFDKIKLINAST